jgi:hypothetical protein
MASRNFVATTAFLGVLGAMNLCVPATLGVAVAQPVPQPSTPSPKLSEAASNWLTKWKATAAVARAERERAQAGLTAIQRLGPAAALDRQLREGVAALMRSETPPAERGLVRQAMFAEISAVDRENTEILRSALPPQGWFTDKTVATDAWLIAQHSPDRELQKVVLSRLEPAVRTGAAKGQEYAMLYDRLEMFQGRPQRYASQARCTGGAWRFADIESETEVDAKRAEIGWPETLNQTKTRLTIGAPC